MATEVRPERSNLRETFCDWILSGRNHSVYGLSAKRKSTTVHRAKAMYLEIRRRRHRLLVLQYALQDRQSRFLFPDHHAQLSVSTLARSSIFFLQARHAWVIVHAVLHAGSSPRLRVCCLISLASASCASWSSLFRVVACWLSERQR
jgi:hypothetical protein